MFDKSDGVYEMGRETARLISEWIDAARKGDMGFWTGDPAVPEAKEANEGEKSGDEGRAV